MARTNLDGGNCWTMWILNAFLATESLYTICDNIKNNEQGL
jgi:hypothetical protein